jgi:light-regulated signal transduction histidine kinase (bacteriophytochrome)
VEAETLDDFVALNGRRRTSLRNSRERLDGLLTSVWIPLKRCKSVSRRASTLRKSYQSTQLQRIFEAYYTTKSQGMGMGLAISRSIIEAHGGWLWAKTNTPRGALFEFTLPVPDPASMQQTH